MSNKTSKQVRESKILLISQLLDEWQSDEEIMQMLKISKATYYRYKQQVYKNDKALLDKVRTGELEHRERQVRNSLHYCIKINKDICEHSKDDKARIEASATIVRAQRALLNLATEPHYNQQVRIISKNTTDNIKQLEDKVLEDNTLDNNDSNTLGGTNTDSSNQSDNEVIDQ